MVQPLKRARDSSDICEEGRAGRIPKLEHSTSLSHEALEQHDQAVKDDRHVAESAVRAEGIQMYHQALFEMQTGFPEHIEASSDNTELHGHAATPDLVVDISLEHIKRMHRPPAPSAASPMQRYLTIDAISDPFPLYAKKALSDMSLDCGSLATVEARSKSAKQIAKGLVVATDAHPEIDMMDMLASRRAQSAPTDGKLRVRKLTVQPRRAAEGDMHGRAKRTKTE
ncbi:hypothetical protein LTR36_009271 [Oleoguttula mirabilis]|uniref:Uncharacterized protein n=1 Tax=Oleoguttula mirabilis TaxID=1507867 RepID=A0AAV9J606_9PEZI|nr:hypothetical protein LTR36_009271 [Oleoguttula mirabilis]